MEFEMGWNKFNLMLVGVWPEPTETSKAKQYLSNVIFGLTSVNTFLFICLPQTAHLILKSTNLNEAVENLSINVPISFSLSKQLVLRYHKKGDTADISTKDLFQVLILLNREILNDWAQQQPESERQMMMKNAKLSRQISIACSTFTYLMLLAFLLLQIWDSMQNTSENNLDGLLYPTIFPYNVSRTPNYQITWIGQLIATILTAICYSTFDTLLAMLVLHLCGQLMVLKMNLRNLVNATQINNFSEFQERLSFIVQKHERLNRFAVVLEDCFNLTLLVQTLIATSMFCLTGYRLIISVDQEEQEELPLVGLAFFIIHVLYTMILLFIYCYIGEQLLSESTSIAQSVYDCEWYNLPPKKAISLITIIIRGNISFKLTAGKFSPFSLELFSTILKTSASYLSVLLAMKD